MKNLILVILILITIPLSACTSAAPQTASLNTAPTNAQNEGTTTSGQAAGTTSANATNGKNGNALLVDMQLLVGMLKLEGSDLAITKEQATSLLPLLAKYQTSRVNPNPNAGGSDQTQKNNSAQQGTPATDAQVNTDELTSQIQTLLSVQQIKAITDMQLTQDSITTILQAEGITLRGGPQNGGNNHNQPMQGTAPAGNGNNGNNNAAPTVNGTPLAPNGQNGNGPQGNPPANRGRMVSPQLIEKLIEILDGKAGIAYSTPTPFAQ